MSARYEHRHPTCLIAGRLAREYVLLPKIAARLDACGGSLTYSAGGLAVWGLRAALLALVPPDFPAQWIRDLANLGFDVRGIARDEAAGDMREFVAYSDSLEVSAEDPISQFSRRGLTFPKSLLGFRAAESASADAFGLDKKSAAPFRVPADYLKLHHAHFCPLEISSHIRLLGALGEAATVTAEPPPGLMRRYRFRGVDQLLRGVTVVHVAEADLRRLFWGETNDLWDMMAQTCAHGPGIVVVNRGPRGHCLFDESSKLRAEIPAWPSRVVDPTGAHHAFAGGFLAGMQITGEALEAALFGSVSASLKVEGSGPFYPLEIASGLADARLTSLRSLVSVL